MKTILLYANDDEGVQARFDAAVSLTRALDGHLYCLQATPYSAFVMGDPFGGIYAIPTVIGEVREAEESHQAKLEARLKTEGVPWTWTRMDGQPAQLLIDRARLADLVVLSLPRSEGRIDTPLSLLGNVATAVRSAVLAVPPEGGAVDLSGAALVAWNGSAEACHALRFVRPLLQRASRVQIVAVDEDKADIPPTDAAGYLARYGIRATIEAQPPGERSIAETICEASDAIKAAYVVMGAYGHSRFREMVLGGVTRAMLTQSRIPLILAH